MEKWRRIKNYPYYMISTFGRVRSLERVIMKSNNRAKPVCDRILKHGYNQKGYPVVVLHENKEKKTITVHRLVAETFIPNPDNKPQINHKNGIKDDNRVENIEWATQSENMLHAYKNGLIKRPIGENHPYSKLSNNEVLAVKQLLRFSKLTQGKIGELFGVSGFVVHNINSGKNYSNVEL